MKINIEVDCTAAEARHFLGLPDVTAMQERLMLDAEKRLQEVLKQTDPKLLMEQWLPTGMQGFEQWQGLWTQMAAAAAGLSRTEQPKK